jgi:hypothetical protein
MPASLEKTSAAESHLTEGPFLLEEETLSKEKRLIYKAGTQRPTVSKRGQDLKPTKTSIMNNVFR